MLRTCTASYVPENHSDETSANLPDVEGTADEILAATSETKQIAV